MADKELDQIAIDVAPEAIEAQIGVTIEQFKKKRKEAADKLEKGQRLKRTTFESLEDKGLLDPKTLYAEFQKIEKRESRLSSAERQLISEITLLSMQEVFTRKIDEARKAGEIKPRIPKKQRAKKITPKQQGKCEK